LIALGIFEASDLAQKQPKPIGKHAITAEATKQDNR
jgi:hypothetical protein